MFTPFLFRRALRHGLFPFVALVGASLYAAERTPAAPAHTFAIGESDFLIDGQRLQIRCGEIHFARVPRAYWQDRLHRAKAMGLNTVCAYLFWNFHEWKEGEYHWADQADAAEFCRLAQQEGLWVILRPGPYACAEWEMGGLPWWLLKHDDIKLRTRDPQFMSATAAWLKEVGRVLAPQQITHGGPILMVQVENEYGFYGKDLQYLEGIKKDLVDAGFDVPLFACNPASNIGSPTPADLFKVVNFGKAPGSGFKALRAVQPTGPLMCGEFYPGWFDTWGAPHHLGNTPQYLADLEFMLVHGASFSIYMAHGGTSFGLWSGADRPFKPDTSSYDYDAPIAENGALGEKFRVTRELISKYLLPGETLPPIPGNLPTTTIPRFSLTEVAPIFANLPEPQRTRQVQTMEAYDQARGAIVYRTTLPPGPGGVLDVESAHDFAFVYLDGKRIGIMDRRQNSHRVALPARAKPAQLDLFVYALGRVNFGPEVHDRKGLTGPVRLLLKDAAVQTIENWEAFSLPLEDDTAKLKWETATADSKRADGHPAFWRGHFTLGKPADTYLDLTAWGFGVVWINGHCLGRFWDIGPTQTAYVPGPWLKTGENEVVVFDVTGPREPVLAGLAEPILNKLRPELDFTPPTVSGPKPALDRLRPVVQGTFSADGESREVKFPQAVSGRQFCFEAVSSYGGPVAAVAELDLLDAEGRGIPHTTWTIAYVDSEEKAMEDGTAGNAIDGQTANAWVTGWSSTSPGYPHRLVIDLGQSTPIGGFRFTPRQSNSRSDRIKDYRIYVGDAMIQQAK